MLDKGFKKELWVAGQISLVDGVPDNTRWQFQGIFDSEELAVAACWSGLYFVGPVVLNEELPDELTEWPGCYYPEAG